MGTLYSSAVGKIENIEYQNRVGELTKARGFRTVEMVDRFVCDGMTMVVILVLVLESEVEYPRFVVWRALSGMRVDA